MASHTETGFAPRYCARVIGHPGAHVDREGVAWGNTADAADQEQHWGGHALKQVTREEEVRTYDDLVDLLHGVADEVLSSRDLSSLEKSNASLAAAALAEFLVRARAANAKRMH